MTKLKLLYVLGLSLCLCATARADVHSRLIKETAERTNKALLAADYATVADLTHPKLVQVMGGRPKLIATMQSTVAQMKAQGITLKSASIDNPTDAIAAKNGHLFAVVPFSISVALPFGVATQKSFLIANSIDQGRSWKFVDAGNVEPATLKQVLPNLPATLKLPPKQDPTIERNTATTVSPKPSQPAGAVPTSTVRKTNTPPARTAAPAPSRPKK